MDTSPYHELNNNKLDLLAKSKNFYRINNIMIQVFKKYKVKVMFSLASSNFKTLFWRNTKIGFALLAQRTLAQPTLAQPTLAQRTLVKLGAKPPFSSMGPSLLFFDHLKQTRGKTKNESKASCQEYFTFTWNNQCRLVEKPKNQACLASIRQSLPNLLLEQSKSENQPISESEEPKFYISCKESRIETNTSFYGCFYLGPFEQGESVTIANALRRTLLSDLTGVAITSVEIEGAVHEYASLAGVRESVLDIVLNLKEIILKQSNLPFNKTFIPQSKSLIKRLIPRLARLFPATEVQDKKKVLSRSVLPKVAERKSVVPSQGYPKGKQSGYLRARGPGVVRASDLKLPPSIVCVDPEQYIATLADDGILNMKFWISEGKNYLIQVPDKKVLASSAARLNAVKRKILSKKKLYVAKMKQQIVNHSLASYVSFHDNYSKPIAAEFSPSLFYGSYVENKFCEVKKEEANLVRKPPFSGPGSPVLPSLEQSGGFFAFAWNKRKQKGASEINPERAEKVSKTASVLLKRKKSFSNCKKEKRVYNYASNGNILPIDAVFMPVQKINFLIENDQQYNDNLYSSDREQTPFLDPKSARDLLAKGELTDDFNPSLLSSSTLEASTLTKNAQHQGSYFSSLLVNPILKNLSSTLPYQPNSLFLKRNLKENIEVRSFSALNPSALLSPSFLKDIKKDKKNSTEGSFSALASRLEQAIPKNDDKFTFTEGLDSRLILSNAAFTFLHPVPFLKSNKTRDRLKTKQQASDSLKSSTNLGREFKTEFPHLLLPREENLLVVPSKAEQFGFAIKKSLKVRIVLEIWTNGSIHPRKALFDGFKSMITLFSRLQKVKILGSMLRSERFYKKLIEKKFKTQKKS